MNQDLTSYYSDRGKEYDQPYANPAEQDDLQTATMLFQKTFAQKTVLEIACGTGCQKEQSTTKVEYQAPAKRFIF